MFPYYLSIGMTPDQYWSGDAALVRTYRKAEELRKDRLNQEMWWQGMYIYEALCDASPLFRAFGKKNVRAAPYLKEPYDIKPKKKADETPRSAEKKQMLKMKHTMEAFAAKFNANHIQKGRQTDGERNDDRQSPNRDKGIGELGGAEPGCAEGNASEAERRLP